MFSGDPLLGFPVLVGLVAHVDTAGGFGVSVPGSDRCCPMLGASKGPLESPTPMPRWFISVSTTASHTFIYRLNGAYEQEETHDMCVRQMKRCNSLYMIEIELA